MYNKIKDNHKYLYIMHNQVQNLVALLKKKCNKETLILSHFQNSCYTFPKKCNNVTNHIKTDRHTVPTTRIFLCINKYMTYACRALPDRYRTNGYMHKEYKIFIYQKIISWQVWTKNLSWNRENPVNTRVFHKLSTTFTHIHSIHNINIDMYKSYQQ